MHLKYSIFTVENGIMPSLVGIVAAFRFFAEYSEKPYTNAYKCSNAHTPKKQIATNFIY
jgi:hypothetical protein